MVKKIDKAKPAREKLSLHPLTPDQAIAAALRIKPTDMAKMPKDKSRRQRGRKKGKKLQ